MSTIIKFELKQLRKLANNKNSCVVERKVTQNLALQPWCLGNLKESIKNLLDYKIGKYDKEFNGIIMSYKNLRVLQNVGAIRNDNADVHFQVQADYFIFQPHIGATLKGVVNKKSTTHLGLLVHRVFNVVIPRPTEEPGDKWIGSNIQEGQEVEFQIVVLDLYGALPYIRGELDERNIETANDNEYDEIDAKSVKAMNVSYVDFDKTKPHPVKKLIADGLSTKTTKRSSLLKKTENCNKSIISNDISKTEVNRWHDKKFKDEVNLAENSKYKGKIKQTDTELKPVETCLRVPKKLKKIL